MGKWLLTFLVLGFSLFNSPAEEVPVFRSVQVLPHSGGLIFPTQIAVDSQENTYIAGGFEGAELTLGQITHTNRGATDGFVAKLDSAKNVLWARRIGGTDYDPIHGLAVDSSDNVFFAATLWSTNVSFGGISLTTTSNHMSVVFKLDGTTGATLWHRKLDGVSSDGWGKSLAVDPQGNVYISGTFENGAIFLRKLDSTGNTIAWTFVGGRCIQAFAPNIYVNASGQTFLSGTFTNSTATFGQITLTNQANYTGYAVKFGNTGNVLWAVPVASEAHFEVTDVAGDEAGNTYVLDYTISLTQITTNGQVGWKKQIMQRQGSSPPALARSRDGGVLVVGSSYDEGVLIKISSSGQELWRKSADSRVYREPENPYDSGYYISTASSMFFSRAATDKYGRIHFAGVIGPSETESICAFDSIVLNPVPRGILVATVAYNPVLARLLNGNFLTLSWPTNEPGFLLQSSDLLAGDWQAIPETVSISNGAHTVTREISGDQQFYRLRKASP